MNKGHNHCELSQEMIEWISGELLGDGCFQSSSSCSARFTYGSKYLEYIEYIKNTLELIKIKGRIHRQYHKRFDCYTYHYSSLNYIELLPLYKKWYPEGKKIIPRDIKLTPLTLRQWFIGDGTYYFTARRKRHLWLCSQGFTRLDVDWLVERLITLGFKSIRRLCSNRIRISSYSIKSFLNYVGPCPVQCYEYKWDCKNKGGDEFDKTKR
jgi:hypothetical protein